MLTTKKLGLALSLALSLVAVACAAPAIPDSAPADDNGGGEDTVNAPTKKTTPAKAPSTSTDKSGTNPTPANPTPTTPNPSDPNPTTPPPTGGNCAASKDAEACFTCCDQASGGELAKADAAFDACACAGQCASACGNNFCSGRQESAACGACLQQKCVPLADAACTSAACKAGEQCLATSCAGKP